MKIIWYSLKANLYKMIHSKLLWIHILLPISVAVIFNIYFATTARTETEAAKLYLQVLAILFPIMIAIATTLVYESDFYAGKFQIIRMLAAKKANGHMGNLLALIFLGSIASVLAVVGFGLLFHGMEFAFWKNNSFRFPLSFYVKIWGLLLGVNIIGYFIQYMLCYTFGRGVSLGVGMVGTLIAPLMYLGMGDFVWKWIPCSYGIRMISYYLIANVSGQEEHFYLINYIKNELDIGEKTIVGITILAGVLFYYWGNVWEASRVTSD